MHGQSRGTTSGTRVREKRSGKPRQKKEQVPKRKKNNVPSSNVPPLSNSHNPNNFKYSRRKNKAQNAREATTRPQDYTIGLASRLDRTELPSQSNVPASLDLLNGSTSLLPIKCSSSALPNERAQKGSNSSLPDSPEKSRRRRKSNRSRK